VARAVVLCGPEIGSRAGVVDGEPHGDYIQIEKDKTRDKFLEGLGLTVLRFENRLVFQDPEYILKEIRKEFKGEDKCS
jgi:very-short-patch-repair endonuclease